jgi:hypothetical protein
VNTAASSPDVGGGALGSVPRLKLYPDVSSRRRATIVRDLGVLLALLFFVWFGFKTYHAVNALKVLGSGVETAGTSVQNGFASVAGVVDGIPVVGDKLAGALQGAGVGTGGEVADLGRQGVERVHDLAIMLGLFVFCLPAFVVLAAALPGRIRQVRRLTAASVVLANPQDEDRRRLLAMRAGFGLPYGVLLKYTLDPLGDLADGRYDALVAAALDDAGVVPRER